MKEQIRKTDSLPESPTLADFQRHIRETVEENHWTKDPNEIFVLFTEEVGELARELRKKWAYGKDGVSVSAGSEIADIFMYLVDLANHFDVDLESSVREKLEENKGRTWDF